jgi:DMSO/TMAO reductase YedYZ molybdopterin-dependent catalytic subunit
MADAPRTDGERSLVERRMSYLRRRMEELRERGDLPSVRTPQGTGATNRHGMPRVPVGQHEVTSWPVLDLGQQPDVPTSAWTLEVAGRVERAFTLDWRQFLALPQVDDASDFHCVTTWSRLDNRWRGVRFATIAELALPLEDARFVVCTGYDRDPGSGEPYTTNLPLDRALDPDVLLVHTWEGRPLPREHGGPVRMITPRLYAWKGTKWIRRIEFVPHDQPGFWEQRGYSNSAEPWLDDRYRSSR